MSAADAPARESAPDVSLAAATRQCDALRASLRGHVAAGAAGAATDRSALRAEIIDMIRTADAQAQAWRALAAAARALPELWKQLPTAAGPTAAVVTAAVVTAASARSDHLGASTFVAKGWSAYAAGDFVAADRAFERALALAPDDGEAMALLAWARAASGRDDDALMAAHRVLVAGARGPASLARVAVGRACLAKAIVGEAIEHFARVVRDNDDRRATLYATFYLGVAYQGRAMYDDAVAYFGRALALGPNLVEARYELGCTHWSVGAHEAACAEWRAGAAGAFSPWARRCAERLAAIDRGGPATGA